MILKQRLSPDGYPQVQISKDGKIWTTKIHRLVCSAFNENPENKETVNHKDGIKTHNYPHNLEWATRSENVKHAYDTGLKKPNGLGKFGDKHHGSIPVIQLSLNGCFIREYDSTMTVERDLKINHSNISSACKRKVHTAGGFKWMYKTEYYGIKDNG